MSASRFDRDVKRAVAEELEKRPVCEHCDNHIQDDHYYDICGEIVCPTCLERYNRREIED